MAQRFGKKGFLMAKSNLFDVVDQRMFSVFARTDARSNYDLLSCIFDLFTNPEPRQTIAREELIDDFTAYIKNRDFEAFEDEEGNDESNKPAREKAILKINQFKRIGWLEQDNGIGFEIEYSFSANGITMMEAFRNMIQNENRPLEYSGYFYLINGLLSDFDYSEAKGRLEQIFTNTNKLFNSLQGLNSSIKKYIEKLIKQKDLTAEQAFDMFLNKYQNQIILTVFNNLKGRDNPSKYTSRILDKLRDLRENNLDNIVNSYLYRDSSEIIDKDEYRRIEDDLIEQFDKTIARFDHVNEIVSLIDKRNAKFHTSAVAKIQFLLNTRNDIEGLLDKSLKALVNVPDDIVFDDFFDFYSSDLLDDRSTYSRSFNKEKITSIKSEIPDINPADIERAKRLLEEQETFNRQNIDEFVLKLLDDGDSKRANDLNVVGFENLVKLMICEAFSSYEEMSYRIEILDDSIEILGFRTRNFVIYRK